MIGPDPTPAPLTSDERTWGMFAWLGALLVNFISCGLGFIAPLIIMLTKGKDSPFVRANAVESLNVFITCGIAIVATGVLYIVVFVAAIISPVAFVGLFLVMVVGLAAVAYGLTLAIVGSVQANKGIAYRAPFALRFVK